MSSRSRLRAEMVGCCLTGVDKILMSSAGASIDEREAAASAVGAAISVVSNVAEGKRAVTRPPFILTFSFTCNITAALISVVFHFINYMSSQLLSALSVV